MPEQLWFTKILNGLFAGPVNGLLQALHVSPRYPQAPIPNFVAMEILVFLFLIALFAMVRSQLSVDKPGALQHAFEGMQGFVENQSHEIIGDHSEVFTPFLVSLGIFILLSNLLGLVPGFASPTATPAVPLGCAIVAFFYYQGHGFKHAGIGYLKHFAGPIPALAPLMIPIELISHLARVMSLTIRLYANMFAGDLITLAIFSLLPIGLPVVFLGFHTFVAFLQTYIFLLLTMVYLAGAVVSEHEH